jgi:hypothetical protein
VPSGAAKTELRISIQAKILMDRIERRERGYAMVRVLTGSIRMRLV